MRIKFVGPISGGGSKVQRALAAVRSEYSLSRNGPPGVTADVTVGWGALLHHRPYLEEAVQDGSRVLNRNNANGNNKGLFLQSVNEFNRTWEHNESVQKIYTPESLLVENPDVTYEDLRLLFNTYSRVVLRANLVGSGGEGVYVIQSEDVLGREPNYRGHTRKDNLISFLMSLSGLPRIRMVQGYFPKLHEFRVHVFGGVAFAVQKKTFRLSGADRPTQNQIEVRNHSNGWYYNIGGVLGMAPPSGELIRASINSVLAAGMDFGAVDVGMAIDGRHCVFEVNSRPGINDSRLATAYAYFIHKFAQGADLREHEGTNIRHEERTGMWKVLAQWTEDSMGLRPTLTGSPAFRQYDEFLTTHIPLVRQISGT